MCAWSAVGTHLLLACDERVGQLLPRVCTVVIGGDLMDGFGHVCGARSRLTSAFSSASSH